MLKNMWMDVENVWVDDRRVRTSKVRLEVLCDLTTQTLEGDLSDEKLGRLLVATDFTKGDGSWLVSVGLLDTSGRWGRFASSSGSKFLAKSLYSDVLAFIQNQLADGES